MKTMNEVNQHLPKVVRYKKELYLAYKAITPSNGASLKVKLLKPSGEIYQGTPHLETIEVVKHNRNHFYKFKYNGHYYAKTKIGMISLTSGKIMSKVFETRVLDSYKD